LAGAGAVEADATLALEEDHARVEETEALHLAVAAEQELGGHARVRGRIGGAVVAEDAEEAQIRGQGGRLILRRRGLVLGHRRDHSPKRRRSPLEIHTSRTDARG
jgi:hypothetical protein